MAVAMIKPHWFRPGRNMHRELSNPGNRKNLKYFLRLAIFSGILAIEEKFELTAHCLSSDGLTWTYNCKYRLAPKVRCQATAKVSNFDGHWRLTSAEDNHRCEPNRARVTSEKLKHKMKKIVKKDPAKPVSHAAKKSEMKQPRNMEMMSHFINI